MKMIRIPALLCCHKVGLPHADLTQIRPTNDQLESLQLTDVYGLHLDRLFNDFNGLF